MPVNTLTIELPPDLEAELAGACGTPLLYGMTPSAARVFAQATAVPDLA